MNYCSPIQHPLLFEDVLESETERKREKRGETEREREKGGERESVERRVVIAAC